MEASNEVVGVGGKDLFLEDATRNTRHVWVLGVINIGAFAGHSTVAAQNAGRRGCGGHSTAVISPLGSRRGNGRNIAM